MDPTEQRRKVDDQIRFLTIISTAFVFSVGVFVILAWFVTEGPGAMDSLAGGSDTAFVVVGSLVAIGLLLAAPVVQRRLIERSDPPGPDGELTPVLENYRMAVCLAFLLREGAALAGLMITLLTGNPVWTYLFAAAAVVAMFWGWPRREDLSYAPALEP